jgi:predicted transcriptional regulator
MMDKLHLKLSRRERQIMDVIYQRGQASVADVLEDLPEPPSYSAVRALLRILEEKGFLTHTKEGPRYVYAPTLDRQAAGRSALQRLLETFFDGSMEKAVAAMLEMSETDLSDEELDRLSQLIERARSEGD